MKLYYAPGACSQASHIALRESGLDFQLEKVDLRQKVTASGEDYRTINPLGYVPALQLDSGDVITEGPAIMQFIADLAPAAGLLPAAGIARYRAIGWLNFIATELHKTCSRRCSIYVLVNIFTPPNNHDFASLCFCSHTRNHAK